MKLLGEKVLWQRTRDYIKHYKPLLIGVTGSTGKTFTKAAVSRVLSDYRQIRPITYDHREPIEVALSILGIKRPDSKVGWMKLLSKSLVREISKLEPDAIVTDLPADKPGNIDLLARAIPFNIGIVTNIGSTHLRLYGDKNMVAHEKASLIASLPADGYAILNMDDPLVWEMKNNTIAKVISIGTSSDADVYLKRAQRLSGKGFAVEIVINNHHLELYLPHLIARQQVYGVLGALAVVLATGGDIKQALDSLREIRPLPGRMNLLTGINKSKIIDNSYSASPESVLVAMHTMKVLPADRRIAILGDLLDLGGRTVTIHEKIGRQIAGMADIFVGVGDNMRMAQATAIKSAAKIDTHHFHSSRDVGKWMMDHIRENDLILIKGSRDMKMREVVLRLLANPERDEKYLVQ